MEQRLLNLESLVIYLQLIIAHLIYLLLFLLMQYQVITKYQLLNYITEILAHKLIKVIQEILFSLNLLYTLLLKISQIYMKYFYLYIFFLFCFLIFNAYLKTYYFKEGFETNNKNYILLGDSILKNNSYVSDGQSIENLLIKRNINVNCLAEDHSKIVDIYSQIDKMPIELNTPNTLIFLSAGGNDILSYYVDQHQDITNSSVLKPMFSAYKKLIKSIQTKLPKAKIILLDIYYPDNLKFKQYHSIIKEWNNMIYEFADNPQNNIYCVIRISNSLTQHEDFSFGIEPSSSGGKKIADLILGTY